MEPVLLNKYPLLSKTVVIGLLMLLLAIPLAMVRDLIHERGQYREAAEQDIARAHAGSQRLSGPVLYVPYTETFTRIVAMGEGGGTREERVTESHVALRFPTLMDTVSQLDTEVRQRGIYPVTVYTSAHEVKGRFVWHPIEPREKGGLISLGQPLLLLGVSDLRGLRGVPRLQFDGQALTVSPAPASGLLPLPLAAPLDAAHLRAGAALPFSLQLELAGTGSIAWVPLADDNRVQLRSSWPHPSFGGDFLPRSRKVDARGFEASWSVPALSTQAQRQFVQHAEPKGRRDAGPAQGLAVDSFAVSLNDPVDIYRLTERATKYALMFIVLTFAAFFVFEMVRRWRIHPMQYLMIGVALVLFFMLLLSLSERIAFVHAYLLASTACIGLIAHYLRHVLGGWRAGLTMGAMFVALYGVLYGILVSEDNALLMGSMLLFGVLAAIMIATRKVDWYSVMGTAQAVDEHATRNAGT